MALLANNLGQRELLAAKAALHAERLDSALKRKEAKWPARGFRVECFELLTDRNALGALVGLRKRNGSLLGQHRFYFSNPPIVDAGVHDPHAAFKQIVTEAVFDRYARLGLPPDPDDPDPTLTAYGLTADNAVASNHTTYSNARAGANVEAGPGNQTSDLIGQDYGNLAGSTYYVFQGFFGWDTSSIADTDTIDAVTLSMYLTTDYSTTDFTTQAYTKDWGAAVGTEDWTAGASMSALTKVASIASSGIGAADYKAFTSVAAFLSAINVSGNTLIMLGSSRQEAGNTPTGFEMIEWYFADYTGTTRDPKLVVDSTAAASNYYIPAAMRTQFVPPFVGG